MLEKEEAICLELGNKDSLQISYGNQGLILQAWGRLEEALALHKKQEAICLELDNKDSLQYSYGNQGLILKAWGRLEEALALHKKAGSHLPGAGQQGRTRVLLLELGAPGTRTGRQKNGNREASTGAYLLYRIEDAARERRRARGAGKNQKHRFVSGNVVPFSRTLSRKRACGTESLSRSSLTGFPGAAQKTGITLHVTFSARIPVMYDFIPVFVSGLVISYIATVGLAELLPWDKKTLNIVAYPVRYLGKTNDWIATKLNLLWEYSGFRFRNTKWGVLQWESLGLGIGFMQIGEWLLAIIFFVLIASIGIGRSFTDSKEAKRSLFRLLCPVIGWFALAALLVTITVLHKPETDPWSNLQKLWDRPSIEVISSDRRYSIVAHTVICGDHYPGTADFACVWEVSEWREDGKLRDARSPVSAFVYFTLTNMQPNATYITDLNVEVLTSKGWVETTSMSTSDIFYFVGPQEHLKDAIGFTSQMLNRMLMNRAIEPKQPTDGWLALCFPYAEAMRFYPRFKIIITDSTGEKSVVEAKATPTGGLADAPALHTNYRRDISKYELVLCKNRRRECMKT